MRSIWLLVLLLVAALSLSLGWSEDAQPAPAAPAPTTDVPKPETPPAAAKPKIAKHDYHFLTGKVTVGDNLATVDLPDGFRFLASADARYVLEKVWENPPSDQILGLIFPPDQDAYTADGWAVVVTFEAEGYIKDDDAKSMNYDDMLKQLQEGTAKENPARKAQGYPEVQLLGWAEPPHYDSATKTLYWAKRLRFSNTPENQLNYNIRVLGRRGVLELNPLAAESQLATVAAGGKMLLAKTAFTPGNRYEDYSASSGDKVAAYGVAGLITGGLLLKTGLLKLLLKPLLFGGAVLVGVIAKLFGKGKAKAQTAPETKADSAAP